jgi:FkbM family methyltransferase
MIRLRFRMTTIFIAALALFAALMGLRNYIPSAISMARMTLRNEDRYYTFKRGWSSFAETERQSVRTREIMRQAHFVSLDSDAIETYQFDSGRLSFPKGGIYDISDVIAEQERGIYDEEYCRIHPGDVVLDVGAHVGAFARHALKLGASRVIAIEPVPINIECLRRNLKSEIEAGRVIIYSKGVWDKDDFLEMSIFPGSAGAASFVKMNSGESAIKLPLTTLDKLAGELGLTRIDFIKMDIEGAERRALRGAQQILLKYRPRMALCMYHLPDDPVVIPNTIRSIRTDYQQSCGICAYNNGRTSPYQDRRITPRVYFYY